MSFLQQELARLMKNERQREAYLWDDHCVVQAGPGSGKTAVLALKIVRLLTEQIPAPRGLACLTFNNEAVREFRNRLKKMGLQPRTNVFLGTVHSFCLASVIKPFGKMFNPKLPFPFRVASEKLRGKCLQKAMDKVGIKEPIWQFQTRFDRYRRTNLDRTCKEWLSDEESAEAIESYEAILRSNGYIDFDDLILISLQIVEKEAFVQRCLSARFPWIVVDEYQDLGYPLHRIIVNLMEKTDIKIFAVGDPDQSIYGFAGADPKYLQELSQRGDVKPIRLELNYRCGQKIINGAEIILSPPSPRNYKSSRGNNEPGEIYFIERSAGLESQAVMVVEEILPQLIKAGYEPKEIAILYIDRNDANVITKVLDTKGIKYAGERDQRYRRTPVTRWIEDSAQWCCGIAEKEGGRFKEILDFWTKLLAETKTPIRDEELLLNMCYFFEALSPLRNAETPLLKWLSELDKNLSLRKRLSLLKEMPEELESFDLMLSACQEGNPLAKFTVADLCGCGPNSNVLSLNTLHSSKGLQFDVVIIPGLEEGRLPSWSARSDHALREARRTFYVGFTRARYLVYILFSGWYENLRGVFENGPSRFVIELENALS
jgi:DNA helicase-2/ATP-dependent DNA helicase PcrA